MSDGSSIAKLILAAEAKAPPALATYVKAAAPVLAPVCRAVGFLIDTLGPLYASLFRLGCRVYETLPLDLFSSLMGLGIAFCGGAYCTSIAAVEAFRLCGWESTKEHLLDVAADAQRMWAAHEQDERRRREELSPAEWLQHKAGVAALAVKDPSKLLGALGGLYVAWLAVQGTLRLKFAQTVTLGASMAEMATPTAMRVGVPFFVALTPPEYRHWIPAAVKLAVRTAAVSLAWRLQTVVSAVHLAMRGGLLFSRSLLRWARKRGLVSLDETETVADEAVGYAVAALGFYFQLTCGFGLPFPLNLVLFPLSIVEWGIRYAVSSPSA